jgi:hypothetical protein
MIRYPRNRVNSNAQKGHHSRGSDDCQIDRTKRAVCLHGIDDEEEQAGVSEAFEKPETCGIGMQRERLSGVGPVGQKQAVEFIGGGGKWAHHCLGQRDELKQQQRHKESKGKCAWKTNQTDLGSRGGNTQSSVNHDPNHPDRNQQEDLDFHQRVGPRMDCAESQGCPDQDSYQTVVEGCFKNPGQIVGLHNGNVVSFLSYLYIRLPPAPVVPNPHPREPRRLQPTQS